LIYAAVFQISLLVNFVRERERRRERNSFLLVFKGYLICFFQRHRCNSHWNKIM